MKAQTWKPHLAKGASTVPPGYKGRPEGLLVFFDDDLRPVRHLNDWGITATTRFALTTTCDYMRSLGRFAQHLRQTYNADLLGEEIRHHGDALLSAYNDVLVASDEDDSFGDVGASRQTVGTARAALMAFYEWAVAVGRLAAFPFTLVERQTRYGSRWTLAYMQGGRITGGERDPIPRNQLERFYNVGLLGRQPDGRPDPTFQSFRTAQRSAAGFGLATALGLRHAELLHTTIFEVPIPHPDGLTPGRVAKAIAKGKKGRKVVALSSWLHPIHEYVREDRRTITQHATWEPLHRPLYVDPHRTNDVKVTLATPDEREREMYWADVTPDMRRRLVIEGQGSPLVLLDHSKRNGAPLTDKDSLNAAMALAGRRCQQHWPTLDWSFSTHSLRHTFATELTEFLGQSDHIATAHQVEHGRPPAWLELLDRQDKSRIVQDSLGHSDPATSNRYRKDAFWSLFLSVNADPAHNPAVKEDQS